MKASVIIFNAIMAICMASCNLGPSNPNARKYEDAYNSTNTLTANGDEQYVNQSLNTGDTPYSKSQTESVENNPYYNNSLSNGSSPYLSRNAYADDQSEISVSTSSESQCDVVVIVKSGGNIVANAYLKAGGGYTFHLPNGSYQVFFYGGKGWNPNKSMPGGFTGGFVANESYSKDSEVELYYQGLTYELIPQPNGNFSTQQSNAAEIF